ncbi:TetR/AcrR family transcriptional regulator [Clostridium algoriphilum]|uniref:TetR/AcrR family transcriptional regulator n=1 Tax=Clostridium algoriphilum TaxID=198347 RepID=UPI001CF50B67|nr:TetR/AcrR family transcriptional regulator [Clostridium algoriphilum]MCB2294094.1 TetR/AcrR family transcriptional regulator [Clostridium algoriphilum]
MRSKTDSREKILNVAAMLFQLKGYNATGLNEILKVSGSPKGSLYYYFPNGKEELALEAIHLASTSIQARLQIVLDKYPNPIEAIQNLIKNIMEDFKKESKPIGFSISLIALETYLSSQPLREACSESFTDLQTMYVKKLVQSGIEKEIAKELGTFIQIIIEGAITVSLTHRSDEIFLTVSNQIKILLTPYLNNKI